MPAEKPGRRHLFVAASLCLHVVMISLLFHYFPNYFQRLLSRGTLDQIGVEGELTDDPLDALRRSVDIELIEFQLAQDLPPRPVTEIRERPQIVEELETPEPEEPLEVEPAEALPAAPRPAARGPIEIPGPSGGTETMGSDSPDAVVLPPVLVAVVWPDAPPEARRRRETPVKLRVHVTAAGEVSEVQVAEPTGCGPCEAAAIEAARRLRFRPAMRGATPVDAWVSYTVSFKR